MYITYSNYSPPSRLICFPWLSITPPVSNSFPWFFFFLMGPVLRIHSAGNWSFCELMIAMAMSCPDDGIPHPFSLNWHSFCFFFHDAPLVLEGRLQMSYLRLRIQHTQCLWASAFTAIHCKETLLRARLRTASIYGYKHRDLEDKLVLCQCNSTAVISSPSRAQDFPSHVFWSGLQYQTWIPSCRVGLQFSQRVINCPHRSRSTIAQVNTSCLGGWYWRLQGSHLVKIIWIIFLRDIFGLKWSLFRCMLASRLTNKRETQMRRGKRDFGPVQPCSFPFLYACHINYKLHLSMPDM